MSSPAHDALDRLDLFFARTPHGGPQEWLATVRERLDSLTAQVEQLRGEREEAWRIRNLTADRNDELWNQKRDAEAQVEQLTQERDAARNNMYEANGQWEAMWLREQERAEAAEAENARLAAIIEAHWSPEQARALLAASSPPPGDTEGEQA